MTLTVHSNFKVIQYLKLTIGFKLVLNQFSQILLPLCNSATPSLAVSCIIEVWIWSCFKRNFLWIKKNLHCSWNRPENNDIRHKTAIQKQAYSEMLVHFFTLASRHRTSVDCRCYVNRNDHPVTGAPSDGQCWGQSKFNFRCTKTWHKMVDLKLLT